MPVSALSIQATTPARTFREFEAWRKAHPIVCSIHALASTFLGRENFGLSAQLRRAAVSIPASIAAGFRQRGKADKVRFMNLDESSLEECRCFLVLAAELDDANANPLLEALDKAARLRDACARAILLSMR